MKERLAGATIYGREIKRPIRVNVILSKDEEVAPGDLASAQVVNELNSDEKAAREAGDKNLQDQIDFLTKSQDPETINTLKEVFDFLSGYKDSDTLFAELNKISSKLEEKQNKGDYALNGTSYTKEESDAKYLTEHQNLDNYALKSEIPSNTETITATLSDGTTKEITVYVK